MESTKTFSVDTECQNGIMKWLKLNYMPFSKENENKTTFKRKNKTIQPL